mgnify:CR=1 FL=1
MQLPVQICRDKRNSAINNSHFLERALSTNKTTHELVESEDKRRKKTDYYSREVTSGKKGSKTSTKLKGGQERNKFRAIGKKRTSSKMMTARKKQRKATDDEESEEDSNYNSEDEEDDEEEEGTSLKDGIDVSPPSK